jgi:hypothetical protein
MVFIFSWFEQTLGETNSIERSNTDQMPHSYDRVKWDGISSICRHQMLKKYCWTLSCDLVD